MGDEYANRQADRNQRYRQDWETPEVRAWIASLPPHERVRLEREGLLQPYIDGHPSNGMADEDLADTPIASENPDIIAKVEGFTAPVPADPLDDERLWDVLRRLLGELLNQTNAKLTIECLAVVSGIGFLGDSMTEIAKRHGVTRAAVSKRCVELTEKLGLNPSRAMRALTARASYARAQQKIRNHHEQRNRHRR
jgi:DNA-directed RNA polymerase specialized sigma24 family protein